MRLLRWLPLAGLSLAALGLLGAALVPKPPSPLLARYGTPAWTFNPSGRAVAVTESYSVRWTGDGNGEPDSVLATATATNQSPQSRALAKPFVWPVILSFTWQAAPIGGSITTQACARVKRRQSYSTSACSATRAYVTPDVPPPPPVVDTTALQVLGVEVHPDTLKLHVGEARQLCAFAAFADGRFAVRAVERPQCDSMYVRVIPPALRASAAQQARADSVCVSWSATGGTMPVEPCNTPGLHWSLGRPTPRRGWLVEGHAVVVILPGPPPARAVTLGRRAAL